MFDKINQNKKYDQNELLELSILNNFTFLNAEVQKCKAYYDYTDEEMLDSYINEHGFNPYEVLDEVATYIFSNYSKYFKTTLKRFILEKSKTSFSLSDIEYLHRTFKEIFSKFKNQKRIVYILVSILFNIKNYKLSGFLLEILQSDSYEDSFLTLPKKYILFIKDFDSIKDMDLVKSKALEQIRNDLSLKVELFQISKEWYLEFFKEMFEHNIPKFPELIFINNGSVVNSFAFDNKEQVTEELLKFEHL